MPPPLRSRRQIGFADHPTVLDGEVGVDQDGVIQSHTFAEIAKSLNALVTERDGEWCGIPFPIKGQRLIVEDRYPKKDLIANMQQIVDENEEVPVSDDLTTRVTGWRVVNRWHTRHYRAGIDVGGVEGTVYVIRHDDGRVSHMFDPAAPRRNTMLFGPFDTYIAWSVESEMAALDRLRALLSPHMFTCYFLTGQFLERSRRSGLTYFFRKLRPTIVLTPNGSARSIFKPTVDGHADDEMRILTTLCLHPLAYYESTRCGAMVPTDDVIAHLLLMRGDEALFWRRANQHPPTTVESGVW